MKIAKRSLILILLAYPIAYFLTAIFGALSESIKIFAMSTFSDNTALIISQLIPSVGTDASVLSLVICINVFSVLSWRANAQKI